MKKLLDGKGAGGIAALVSACAGVLALVVYLIYNLVIGKFTADVCVLIALGVGAFEVLNDIFLPLQSSGLLLTGLAIVLMLALRKKAALMAPLTFGFIGMMVLGLGGMCAGLSVVAVKMKKKALIAVFILCFFCYMGMGYLAAKKDGSAASNWIEQGVNTLGQILLLLGVRTLDKAGLREFRLPG